MRSAALLLVSVLLPGCMAMIPDSPRITTGNDIRPTLSQITAATKPVPMSIAVHVTREAYESKAVEDSRAAPGIKRQVFDHGALEPHLVQAIKAQAPKAFERVFYTPEFPNVALWKEGIDAVVSIESARANFFTVKDSSKPNGYFGGWEIVLVIGVYTIDGRPLGYYDAPKSVLRAIYRSEVVAPPVTDPAALEAEGKQAAASCGTSVVACQMALEPLFRKMLAEAMGAAMGQAFRQFPTAEVAKYVDQRRSEIDAGYAAFLMQKDNASFILGLREDVRVKIVEMTPTLDKPTINKVQHFANMERTSAQLNAVGGALGAAQAANLSRMGMQNTARLTAMNAQMQTKDAQQRFAELERLGFGGMDGGTQGLLTLISGVASYQQYQAQRQQQQMAAGRSTACPDLLRMRDQAVKNRNDMRSVSKQAGVTSGRLGGQAGAQQEAADTYQTIYNQYCR